MTEKDAVFTLKASAFPNLKESLQSPSSHSYLHHVMKIHANSFEVDPESTFYLYRGRLTAKVIPKDEHGNPLPPIPFKPKLKKKTQVYYDAKLARFLFLNPTLAMITKR